MMCRLLEISTSGYYAWLKRPPSLRSREDAILLERIRWFHFRSRGTYGVPRIHLDLREDGVRVGRKQVARLMQTDGSYRALVDENTLEPRSDVPPHSQRLIW